MEYGWTQLPYTNSRFELFNRTFHTLRRGQKLQTIFYRFDIVNHLVYVKRLIYTHYMVYLTLLREGGVVPV
jgi:hypothetical protein